MNFARGGLVNEDAVVEALANGGMAAYVTDFPGDKILGVDGVVALPHLGASTPESEDNCAVMAANEIKDYLENGNIVNSVNLPNVSMSMTGDAKICVIHKNVEGLIAKITTCITEAGMNIENMESKSKKDYAYTVLDVKGNADSVADKIRAGEAVISHNVYLNDISPDGKKLLCSTSKPGITRCPFSLSSLFEIDLTTLQADTLVAWDAYLGSASYSPDGKQLLVTGSPSAFGGIGKNCGEHPIANDFDTQAFIMDLATKKVQAITRDFNPTVSLVQWNRVDGCIYFDTTDGDCRHIYRYVPKTGGFEMLPLEEDVITSFTLANDNPVVAAYVGGGNTSTGVAYTYDTKKKVSTLLANPMKPVLDKIELGQMEEWNFTASDGTEIKGMVCLPPSFDPNKKYPLIVYYYGGTTPTTRGITSPYCAQCLRHVICGLCYPAQWCHRVRPGVLCTPCQCMG